MREFLIRLRFLFSRGRRGELDEELQFHLDQATQANIAAGMTPQEAHRQARIAFGGIERAREETSAQHPGWWMETILQDVRYALRGFRRNPVFTLMVIATLALGIGACTAIFSVVNAVPLQSLPYGDPGRLVYLFTPNPKFKNIPVEAFAPSYGDFFDIQRQSHSFATMTTFEQAGYNLASHDATVRIGGARVDGNFFSTLQSRPELGRTISSQDAEPGDDGVVVISHALWQSMFDGSMNVLTKSLRLSGRSYRIIGVMPDDFQYPHNTDLASGNPHISATQVWVPLVLSPQQKANHNRSSGWTIARLKPGISVAQAQAEMSTIMARLDSLHYMRGQKALVKPFLDLVVGPVRPLMWLLLGAVSFVLLIACGNAANLLMARAANRTHELGVRATLGAGRGRIVRQMLTESLLLGCAAGFLGIALAYLFLHGLLQLNPGNVPRLNQASLDARVLLFTVAVSVLTSILFGSLPALTASKINLVDFLKSGGSRGVLRSRNRLRSGLIVAEIGLVVILLAGAGLLLRSYIKVESIHTGFSQSTVGMNIHLDARYKQSQQQDAFFQELIGKLRAIPGVKAVGAVSSLPLSGFESVYLFWIKGYANQRDRVVQGRETTPQYFSAMSIPLMEGRFFTEGDTLAHPPVSIINQAFTKTYFPGRDPIGQSVRTGSQWMTVVGVVGDVRLSKLQEAPPPMLYEPFQGENSAYIAVRSVLPTKEVASTVRTVLRKMDPNLALTDIHTMGELVSAATARRRFQTTLVTVFAAIALLLALVGFYGLVAYSVKQRTTEIGTRLALGASRRQVLVMVLRQGIHLVLFGLLFGLAGAFALTRVLASSLYGVRVLDPVTFLAVPVLLLLTTLTATLIPARAAMKVEPVVALRHE